MAVRLKCCGMREQADIDYAIKLGFDALGFIFYEQSPRFLTINQAKSLLKRAPLFVDLVGVFVNPDPALVSQIIDELPIQLLQFHGEESPSFCRQFRLPYIKAIPATGLKVFEDAMKHYHDATAILLDSPNFRGGSGQTFDWSWIPKKRDLPLILAGGLNAKNAATAIAQCRPDALDVCSGVELTPGIKDHQKMADFVKACGVKTP